MAKTIQVKASICCQCCRTRVLKAVSKIGGIDEVSVDAAKGLLTVTGDVDPVCVANRMKKIGKVVDIVKVGPAKKHDAINPTPLLPPCCDECDDTICCWWLF